jgi:phosphoenolpyruvate carboxykinase (GTP)
MRVLRWIVDRAKARAAGTEIGIGRVPRYRDLDWRGLEDFTEAQFNAVMDIDPEAWKQEILSHEELFVRLWERLPGELVSVRELLLSSMWREPSWDISQRTE